MTTGRRYGGTEAAEAEIVQAAVGETEVLPRALERAAALAGKDPATLKAIKQELYRDTLAALRSFPGSG
jgi:enoyl-CoA hydratase/carnithine racemase